jgi:hypothetical protein
VSEPGHPSPEALWTGADEQTREHRGRCRLCQSEYDRVQTEQLAVADWLAAQAAPPPMPVEVAERVHGALGALVEARGVDRPGPGPAPARHPGRWLLVAAGVAATAVVGSAVLLPMQGSDDSLAGADVAAESVQRDEPESADQSAAAPASLPQVPADLVALVATSGATSSPTECGTVLAEQVGAVLRGSQTVDDDRAGVLVVLDEAEGRAVWWVPTCGAGVDQALGRSPLGE